MVQIANPIYDVVFKFLMKDEKVAKLLLSAILGEDVVQLEFRPTEHNFPLGEILTVMRMDFSARIREKDGQEKLVILELQKAKLATDIMRFRRYLGEQYSSKENILREPEPEYAARKALPILSIYFLGHKLDHVKAPVLRVNRCYIDAATGEEIKTKEEFIESLTHDSIIIQIPYLSGKRRTELEQLLVLFDQSAVANDQHFLNIEEGGLPKRYRPLLRRLQKAIADPEVRQTMEAEDDLIEEFKDYQRVITAKEQVIAAKELMLFKKDKIISEKEQAISEKDKALNQKEQAISEKDKALNQKEQAISEKDKALNQKEQAISEKDKALRESRAKLEGAVIALHKSGTEAKMLSSIFRLSVKEVQEILAKK